MTTPNMSSITASLERSLQSFSLNNYHHHNSSGGGGSTGIGSGGDGGGGGEFQENEHDISKSTSETTFELNSHISLPYHWEQCIDLKTGELYYINWRTGMKAKEDPRIAGWNGDFDDEDLEDDDDDDDDSSYDSEDSSSEESPPSFSRNQSMNKFNSNKYNKQSNEKGNNVLVVAGCKICMMYFMVPKQGEDCPKCNGQLLHFDNKSENASSP